MKTSFRQFITDANRRHDFRRRLISILCVLSLLVSAGVSLMLTMPGMTASGEDPTVDRGIVERLTDHSTQNAWLDYFGISVNENSKPVYNTEFVGSIWTDKSVVTDYYNYQNQHIVSAGTHNMLGVLSAIGSSMAITGRIRTPTDTMFILDLSSSMYKNGNSYTSTTLKNMVAAVNKSIDTLLSLNDYNRIGVIVYWGGDDVRQQVGSTLSHGKVLLPLNRYERKTDTSYLSFSTANNYTISAKAVVEGGSEISNEYKNLPATAGTYAQLGIQQAREQFLQVASDDTYITQGGEKITRQPIFVFMSDGRPTASHSHFSDLKYNDNDPDQSKPINTNGMAEWGLNSEANRTSDASDFVFQLTSSYSKLVVGEHYGVDPLFYTLGLGVDKVSMNAMNPLSNDKDADEKSDYNTILGWWNTLIQSTDHKVTFNVTWNKKTDSLGWGTLYDKEMDVFAVPVTLRDGSTIQFPNNISQMNYVDEYFAAANSGLLSAAFDSIVNEIILKSIYVPTQLNPGHNRENTSGEVSFIDQVGAYMDVKSIKGLMVGGVLHTGVDFANTLINDSDAIGTLYDATPYGMAFWDNIIEQLGLDHVFRTEGDDGNTTGPNVEVVQKTNELIINAYNAGQLSYTDADNWSNYIGWYAVHDADNKDRYVGFWDGSDTLNTADLTDPNIVPQERIKTYFFKGDIESNKTQMMDTDLMYITVWVKEEITVDEQGNIIPGEQTVVFSVPASLLPTLKFFVKLNIENNNETVESINIGDVNKDTVFDANGNITTRPIRLIYEVGLRDDITPQNLLDKVDAEYLRQNTNADGQVYFYSNEWERDTDGDGFTDEIGYGKKNTYSYFRPSVFNDRYYYLEDYYFYTMDADGNFQLYTSTERPHHDTVLYTLHPLYSKDGDAVSSGYYKMDVSDKAIDAAVKDGKNNWYVPAGTPHSLDVNGLNRFARYKVNPDGAAEPDPNVTGTLIYRNVPTHDTTDTVDGIVLASTLGNNGRIAVEPKGQLLQKQLQKSDGSPYVAESNQSFKFLIHEGPALPDVEGKAFNYNDGSAVAAALEGKKVSIITLTVTVGNSVSGVKTLTGLKEYTWDANGNAWNPKNDAVPTWDCVYQETYTIVELNTNDRFTVGAVSETYRPEGAAADAPESEFVSKDNAVYQFVYGQYPNGDEDHVIAAANIFVTWEIKLTKVDNETRGNKLPGAVFGLYSPKSSDAMKSETLAASYPDLDFAAVSTAKAVNPATTTEETWYLCQIGTTDDSGVITWSGLMQEEYLIVELEPPPGYYRPVEDAAKKVVQRNTSSAEKLSLVEISNTPGYEMPSTGGSGDLLYICVGSAIMVISAALMLVYLRKRKEEPA